MKRRLALTGATVALFSFAVLAGEGPKKHGKDILHLSIQKRMSNEGTLATASGKVDVHWDAEGNHDHQQVKLELKGLDTNGTYQLMALVDDDTNLTQVATFSPDHEGKAHIELREKGPKHPETRNGHVKAQLPSELQPPTVIHQLLVSDISSDTNGTPVLSADLTAPDKFEYLVKRDLNATDIRAKLEIKADKHKARLRLEAKGLQAGAQYSLALNGNVAGSDTANDEGVLHLRADLQNALDVFALTDVALLDASSNVVVSATLP